MDRARFSRGYKFTECVRLKEQVNESRDSKASQSNICHTTVAVNFAECEPGFRAVNTIFAAAGGPNTVSANLFVYTVSPHLELFLTTKYAKS